MAEFSFNIGNIFKKLTINEVQSKARETSLQQAKILSYMDNYNPQASIYIVESINEETGTYNLVRESFETYTYSTSGAPSGFTNVKGDLYKNPAADSAFANYLFAVTSITGSGGLHTGDKVEVSFYDRNRQKPYIRRILKRSAVTIVEGEEPEPPGPGLANYTWTEAEGSLRKDFRGEFWVYNGQNLDDSLINGRTVYFEVSGIPDFPITKGHQYPYTLVSTVNNRFLVYPENFSNQIDALYLQIFDADEAQENYIYLSQEDKDTDTQTPLPYDLMTGTLHSSLVVDNPDVVSNENHIFLNPVDTNQIVVIEPSYALTPTNFTMYNLKWDKDTKVLLYTYYTFDCIFGFSGVGSRFISVAGDKMIQAATHCGEAKLFSWDGSEWALSQTYSITKANCYADFGDAEDTYSVFSATDPYWSNNSPASFTSDPEHQLSGFWIPYFAAKEAAPSESKIYNFRFLRNGTFDKKTIVTDNKITSTPITLASIINPLAALAYAEIETGTEVTNYEHTVTCCSLNSEDGPAVATQVNCSSPCWYFYPDCPWEECETWYQYELVVSRGSGTFIISTGEINYSGITSPVEEGRSISCSLRNGIPRLPIPTACMYP